MIFVLCEHIAEEELKLSKLMINPRLISSFICNSQRSISVRCTSRLTNNGQLKLQNSNRAALSSLLQFRKERSQLLIVKSDSTSIILQQVSVFLLNEIAFVICWFTQKLTRLEFPQLVWGRPRFFSQIWAITTTPDNWVIKIPSRNRNS